MSRETESTTRALLEAVAAKRAAQRTPRDALTERVLGIVAIAVTVLLAIGVAQQVASHL